MSNGDPIIIKDGNSIEIYLSKDSFPVMGSDIHRHYSPDRSITKLTITEEASGKEHHYSLPSGKYTISIEHAKKSHTP